MSDPTRRDLDRDLDPSRGDLRDASQRMAMADATDIATPAAPPAATGRYTDEHDAHYRALWEAAPDRVADRPYEDARPAYQLGHIAASQPGYSGRDFEAAEPELRRSWTDDFRTRHGEWDAVRRYVRDGYGHARSEGDGRRLGTMGIGTGASAVDPVELERARSGLPSRDDEQGASSLGPVERLALSSRGDLTPAPDEVTPNEAHRERLSH